MKVRRCWLTLLLVGSCIISVLPNSTTTTTTTTTEEQRQLAHIASTSSTSLHPKQKSMEVTSMNHITSPYQTRSYHPGTEFWSKLVPGRRKARDKPDGPHPCESFITGEPEMFTFYSPGYPNFYPNNTDCVRILEAQPGEVIRLDFRDFFDIEMSEGCKFDFLEIRDGGFGYSTLLGQFCGRNFPPMITSKERHLWLHFHSDENIEYKGFVAVYEFLPKPTSSFLEEINCRIETGGFEGFVNNTDVPANITEMILHHKLSTDCMWVITVQPGWRIQLNFLHFELKRPNECDVNFVDIFPQHTDIPSRIKNFCGSAADSVNSETNILHIRYFAEYVAYNSSFTILFTAFRDKGASCAEGEYDCEDATCISDTLRCNGHNNCRFRWDEDEAECQIENGGQSEHVIIIIVVFGLILGGMMVTFFVNCIRKLLRDQKIIREHIRQSKESKLDEIERASAKRSRENLSVKLSPKDKHSQSSLHILDDVSNRYYREVVPISVQNSRSDSKSETILRQHHDIVVQTSLGDDTIHSDRGTCEMGCQTRESLFQPVARQKSTTSNSPHPSGTLRFSTFGYDTPPNPPPPKQLGKFNTSREKSHTAPTTIEMDDLSHTEVPTKPYEICHHHHQHQQHLQQQQLQQQQSQGKGKPKLEETRAFLDIRNSAPDVIIMTSH